MSSSNVKDGHKISSQSGVLFSKIEDQDVEFQINKLKVEDNTTDQSNLLPQKPEVTFDEFSKMDIRVGTILEAERVPKTDKLLKLKVDTGIDIRTIVSGIALFYNPENIVGTKIVMLVNLAPRMIKGIESKGMILMAENSNGELSMVSPAKADSENGSTVK
jgi:methionyl-tRNA synthetase